MDTRKSIVDIVQAVGRAMRKTEGKKYGYVILPVCIPAQKLADYNNYIDGDEQFRDIWKVLKALRAHDESLVDEAVFRDKVRIVTGGGTGGGKGEGGVQTTMDLPELPLKEITEAVYAAIPKKLGDLVYWSEWAKDVVKIAKDLASRVRDLLEKPEARKAFDQFLDGLQSNINSEVTEKEAIDMLVQHIITRPVFEALFKDYSFANNNPVSKSMQTVVEVMDKYQVDSETEKLERFYKHVTDRVEYALSDKSRQDIIRNLYDTFFRRAFPKMAANLGIAYTPIEIVDFIVKSSEYALKKHLKSSLSNREVSILDPFVGTGTFIVRLLQSGLINSKELQYKYENEMHANEIVLLAYYIAAINIENVYHELTEEYKPFEGIVLTDSFQMHETRDLVDTLILPENSERVNRQKEQSIRVIIGNPPYSVGKKKQYENLDQKITDTYLVKSNANSSSALRDSYIRAIRLASNLVGDKGIVAFVTNGSFIEKKATDGLRKCLADEFSHLYIFNLRGNMRGADWKKEGGKIFGSASQTQIAISIMVKDPTHNGDCELFYHDIGDYLSREEKLEKIKDFKSIENIEWKKITPNPEGDWINQRDPAFKKFIAIASKNQNNKEVIFDIHSSGIKTNRDAWVLNFSNNKVSKNMEQMISLYNEQVALRKITERKKIKWTGRLEQYLTQEKKGEFEESQIITSLYRPFCRQHFYFDLMFNESTYQMPKLFPKPNHKNTVICVTGPSSNKGFSSLVTNCLPNHHMLSTSQCFPLYYYEKTDKSKKEVLDLSLSKSDEHGYIRHETITDWSLKRFRTHYQDTNITKENIFWYVYGVLHSPEYRQRFESSLEKVLPRIPLTKYFWAFCEAGEELGKWHLNYEDVNPYPLKEEKKRLDIEKEDYRVHKMAFENKDKGSIIFNDNFVLHDIPSEAYEYIVNGKSAIEWVMERYAVSKDPDSGIVNDPNDWKPDEPEYILNLLKRVVTVSMESVKIIKTLPPLEETV